MKFTLNGWDIGFVAEAPDDITLKQLIKQCDKIEPDWGACGICSAEPDMKVEIEIGYDSIRKVDKYASCKIVESEDSENE